LPYHPPVFPVIESLFFWTFGISAFAARLAVAATVGLSAALLYRLILLTHASWPLAFLSTATFFSMQSSQRLASDVMLEFPSLVFVLAALLCLPGIGETYSIRAGLAFAVLAGAGVWTKHTVFVALIPFIYFLLLRHWSGLTGKALWVSSAAFALFSFALLAVWRPVDWSGVPRNWAPTSLQKSLLHNFWFYVSGLNRNTALWPLLAVGILYLALRGFRPRAGWNRSADNLYI